MENIDRQRLSDRVLEALQMSLAQDDLSISEILAHALELALTRGAGGEDFVERREFSSDVEQAFNDLDELRSKV